MRCYMKNTSMPFKKLIHNPRTLFRELDVLPCTPHPRNTIELMFIRITNNGTTPSSRNRRDKNEKQYNHTTIPFSELILPYFSYSKSGERGMTLQSALAPALPWRIGLNGPQVNETFEKRCIRKETLRPQRREVRGTVRTALRGRAERKREEQDAATCTPEFKFLRSICRWILCHMFHQQQTTEYVLESNVNKEILI